MEVIWKSVKSTVSPLNTEIQTNNVYIRRNVTEELDSSNILYYFYEEVVFTPSEYAQYIDTIKDTPEYIAAQKAVRQDIISIEYTQKFQSFDVLWSKNVALGKKTSAQYTAARTALITELNTKLEEA